MKILFVTQENRIGGATKSLVEMIHGIYQIKSAEEVQIDVMIPKARKIHQIAKKYIESNDINCIEVWYRNNHKKIGVQKKDYFNDFLNGTAVWKIKKIIKRNKYDYIVSNSVSVDVGARAAIGLGIPHIFYVREFMEEDFQIEFRNKKRMRKMIEESVHTIFISDAVKKKFVSNYSLKNVVQFFNGFIVDNYYISNHKILCGDRINILYVGKLQDSKGTMNLLQMFYLMVAKDENSKSYTLEFVGSGQDEYTRCMRKFIEEKGIEHIVKITDFTDKIKDIEKDKDIIIMNSYNEGFGRVTVEGMLAGLLVVGRFCGGTKEILRHRENGLCFDEDRELIEWIEWASQNRDEARIIAKKGQEWAKAEFDCKKTAKNFLDLLDA